MRRLKTVLTQLPSKFVTDGLTFPAKGQRYQTNETVCLGNRVMTSI